MANVTRVPAIIDELVTRLTAALPTRLVVDGPGATDDANPDVLLVGVDDPSSEEAPVSATATQSWAGLGAKARNEQGVVWLTAMSLNGDGNMKAARDAAYATVAAAEAELFADPSLGVVQYGILAEQSLRQISNTLGLEAWVTFSVQYMARLSL